MTNNEYWDLTRNWEDPQIRNKYNVEELKIIQNSVTGAYCRIGKNNDTLIISFKGTELKFNDIFTDLLFGKMVIPYDKVDKKIKVHLGFLTQYMTLRTDLLLFVLYGLKNKEQYKKITIIGHSLGGALATLCMLDLEYNFPIYFEDNIRIPLEGIVFGSPRVGNEYFGHFFALSNLDNSFLNIQNVNDIVPKVPLKCWGFVHVGKVIRIDKPEFPFISIKKHLEYGKFNLALCI